MHGYGRRYKVIYREMAFQTDYAPKQYFSTRDHKFSKRRVFYSFILKTEI